MKKLITLFILLYLSLVVQAQVTKTANVTTAGTLSSVASTYLSTVTNLTIMGTINACDFKTMRDNMPALAVLDISNVTIAAYSGTAGTYFPYDKYYLANKIPAFAFYNYDTNVYNTSLTSITLPNNITSLYGGDFLNCRKLIEILVGASNVNYAALDGVLFNKSKTILIAFPRGKQGPYTVPSSVSSIQSESFSGSKEITSVTIPNIVTSIEDFAFAGCTGLVSLIIPNSIVSIGNSAFVNCSSLSSIHSNSTIPVNLTSSTDVFSGVDKTTCILYVPYGSKNIYLASPQWQDFSKITDGTPIVTTTSATNITNSTASAGGNITDSGTTPVITSGVCWSTSINPTITNNKTTDGTGTGLFTSSITGLSIGTVYHFRAYATNSLGTSYGADLIFATPKTINVSTAGTLSTLLTTDEKNAISNLTITGTIDASDLKTMRDNMLSLSIVDISNVMIAAYTGSFGTYGYGVYLANEIPKNSFGGYLYPSQRAPIKSIFLPSSVINIADYAFYNCYDLNSIIIPNGVTSIGNYAFLGCSNLNNITLPNSVTNIGDEAFYNCSGLSNLTMSNSITSIGNSAFYLCTGLLSIILPNTITFIGSSAFYNCISLASIYAKAIVPLNLTSSNNVFLNVNKSTCILHVPVGSIGAYVTSNQWGLFTNIVDDAPILTTKVASNITSTTAMGGGNITLAGNSDVTDRGVCWSTTTKPTITNSKTSNGTGIGTFTSSITGLSPAVTYHIRAYATNNVGTSYGSDLTFSTLGTVPTITTTTASSITTTTATAGGNVTDAGTSTVTARGICWSTTANPTVVNSKTTDGSGVGIFSSSITGLTTGVTYHIRAYATSSAGTSYGSDITFTTLGTAPTVTTTTASNITNATAQTGGNVTSTGTSTVTARGVCWSTSANPTIADNKTTDGSGIGVFTSIINGLTPATTYHVRAYTTSSDGTSYGSDLTFTTLGTAPTITTTTASSITTTTASAGGNVTDAGTSTVTARGVCWSTSVNPTIANSKTTDGTGIGAFTSSITGLTPNTAYHIRSYATSSVGTSYGSDLIFNTVCLVPASFSLSAPANGIWNSTTPLFQWAASTGASTYNLYIDGVLKKANITSNFYQILFSEAISSGMHTWNIIASNGCTTESNETWSFRVDAVQPTAFSLVSPTDNSWTVNTQPTFIWSASSDVNSGLAKYQLWIDGVLNRDNISNTVTSTTLTTALTNGSHTWEIRAVDNVGNVRNSIQTYTVKVDNMPPGVGNNTCLYFNGNYAFVNYNSTIPLNVFTIETWVYLLDYTGSGNLEHPDFINKEDEYELQLWQDGRLRFFINNGTTYDELYSSTTIPLNQWCHIAATFDNKRNAEIYINGNNVGYTTFSHNINVGSGNLYFGVNTNNWNTSQIQYLNGKMDEVRIWNYVRSESEISANTNILIDGCTGGLVGYWRFNEGEGNVIFDQSDSHNNGVINGAIYQNSPFNVSLCNLKIPTDNQYLLTKTPTFSWGKTSDAGIGFQKFQLFVDCNMVKDNLSDSTWTVTTPLTYGVHTWYVKGFDLLGNNQSSYSRTFYNANTSGVERTEMNSSIIVYPNPVGNELIIESIDQNERRDFEIINSIGQVVYKGILLDKTVVQTGGYSSGIYIVKLENRKTYEFKKFLKK